MDPQNPVPIAPAQPQVNNSPINNAPIPNKNKSKLIIVLIIVGALIITIGSSVLFILMQISFFKTRVSLGPKAQISTTGSTVTVKEKGVSMTAGQDVELPDNFPSDIPLYPNSKVLQIMNSGATGGTSVNFIAQNSDVSAVIDFYKNKMAENGWTGKDVIIQQTGSMINFKKDSKEVQIVAGTSPNGTFFSVGYKN